MDPNHFGSKKNMKQKLYYRLLLYIFFKISYSKKMELLFDANTDFAKQYSPWGAPDNQPTELCQINNVVFFAISDNEHGVELWRTDGTEAGTYMLKDIKPGSEGSYPELLTNVNGTLFFFAADNVHGKELWKSDGTSAGTVLVKDLTPGLGSSLIDPKGRFGSVNGVFIFSRSESNGIYKAFRSDGTAVGTYLLYDKQLGYNYFPEKGGAMIYKGYMYFRCGWGYDGDTLCKTDGTVTGTTILANSAFEYITFEGVINNELVFNAKEPYPNDQNRVLRISGNTISPVSYLPNSTDKEIKILGTINNQTLITLDGEPYKTNGTANGTSKVTQYPYMSSSGIIYNNKLIVDIYNLGTQKWSTYTFDGQGFQLLSNYSTSIYAVLHEQKLFYMRDNDESYKRTLWYVDLLTGSSAEVSNEITFNDYFTSTINRKYEIAFSLGSTLVFSGFHSKTGFGIYRSQNNNTSLVKIPFPVKTRSGIERLVHESQSLNKSIYKVYDPRFHAGYLETDGTAEGTKRINFQIDNLIAPENDDTVLFTSSMDSLYCFNLITGQKTFLRRFGHQGSPAYKADYPLGVKKFGNKYVFSIYTTNYGTELWITDGTTTGTQLLKDLIPGSSGYVHFGQNDIQIGPYTYFTASANNGISGVFRTDGTPAGTHQVYISEFDGNIFSLGNDLYFYDNTGAGSISRISTSSPFTVTKVVTGIQLSDLRVSEGKAFIQHKEDNWTDNISIFSGTSLVNLNINVDYYSNGLAYSTSCGGKFYFSNDNDLYVSNGTFTGTKRIAEAGIHANACYNNVFWGSGIPTGESKATVFSHQGNNIKAINVSSGIYSNSWQGRVITFYNGRYFIAMTDGIYSTNETPQGTFKLLDCTDQEFLGVVKGKLYFAAYTPERGKEIWVTDGSVEGTRILNDLYPGSASGISVWSMLSILNNEHILFGGDDGLTGMELFRINFDCVSDLTIATAIVGKNQNFEAMNTIIATNKIREASNVEYSANKSVILLPGFDVEKGSVFRTTLVGCE
jgi:ELWxxDGT repeat protein